MINLNKYKNLIIWKIIEMKDNIIHLEGEDRCWLPRNTFYYFTKLGKKKFFGKYRYYTGYDFKTMYGIIDKGRIVYFDIKVQLQEMQYIHFYISYFNYIVEIFPSLDSFIHIPPIPNSYYVSENYILKNNCKNIIIYKYSEKLQILFENQYCLQLKEFQKDNIINLRNKIIKYKKKSKNNKKNQIWIINDRKDQAGDNGEYFYRYLLKLKPKGIKFYFAIKRNCSDYERIKKYGNVIDLYSKRYLNIFLKSNKIISSIDDSWVNNPFGEDGNYLSDLYNFDYIYLSNGIIKDDLSLYMNKIIKKFDLIVTSSKYEYNSLIQPNYGYVKKNIILTGLSRFDDLRFLQRQRKSENIILVLPTWRKYIKGTRDLITFETIESKQFTNSTYFLFYNNLINNEELLGVMKDYKYKGILCIHPNFAPHWKYFNQNEFFEVKGECFIHNLLVTASLLITDYSSIFFDFGYIEKPVIYTQFDYEEYRNNHFPIGYFDYEKDGFGPVCYDIMCTIKAIIDKIKNKCVLKKSYLTRVKNFFMYIDEQNCSRIFNSISKIKDINSEIERKNLLIFISFIILIALKKINKNTYYYLLLFFL